MNKRVLLTSILVLGGVLILLNGISVADTCPSPGCVTHRDIRDNAVRSRHIRENIVLGSSRSNGKFLVEKSSGSDILSVNRDGDDVVLGQSGNNPTDTDLEVRDPFFPTSENALFFNASLSDLTLGSGNSTTSGDDGDIRLEDGEGNAGITMDGNTGNITNSLGGSGSVKAWALINSNGSVRSCWRCNTSGSQTRRLGIGEYEVDFSALGTDIRDRPRLATIDSHAAGSFGPSIICLANRGGDDSAVYVRTYDNIGRSVDLAFTLIIY